MINILAVGNSFSENATFYLHQIAESVEIDTKVVNMNIGSCSFERHWKNIRLDEKVYRYELNGYYDEESQINPVSLKEILLSEDWDYIISQQASRDSGLIETYYPYAEKVYTYFRQLVPKAHLGIQQTWAYEIDSTHEAFPRYHCNQLEMYQQLTKCCKRVSQELSLFVIPTGNAIQQLRTVYPFEYQKGGQSLCADGHHLSPDYGKYAAALIWAKTILDIDVRRVNYTPQNRYNPDLEVNSEYLQLINQVIEELPSF